MTRVLRIFSSLASLGLLLMSGVSATAFEATIERDNYGVPHIYGVTDADAAFGLAYAQAEDAWPIMEGKIGRAHV